MVWIFVRQLIGVNRDSGPLDTHISPDWETKKEGKIYIDREAVINIAPNEEDL